MKIKRETICESNGWRLYGQDVDCAECGCPMGTGDTVYYPNNSDEWFCSPNCLHRCKASESGEMLI